MKKPYQLIIFDWEGTLADSIGPILDCIACEAEKLELGYFDLELARQSVNLGLAKAIKAVFPKISAVQYELLIKKIQIQISYKNNQTQLIPGASTIIKALHHSSISLAIASNKNACALEKALHSSQLRQFFAVIRGTGKVAAKPCTQMLTEILDELQLSADQALMIGDSSVDMITARLMGMDAIGFDFYHQNTQDLEQAGAIQVMDTYQKIADFLQITYENNKD